MSLKAQRPVTAFVFGGGGARGAYEVGVLRYLEDELAPALGFPLRPDILSGTSIGGLHACQLAAMAHHPRPASLLAEHWRALHVEDVVRFRWLDVWRLFRDSIGRRSSDPADGRGGGLVDPGGLAKQILYGADWPALGRNIRNGTVKALAITATHVASGKPTVFIQRGGPNPIPKFDSNYRVVPARIGPRHAIASAAIPILFPPVEVRGELYVDGGLRMNVPLSPAVKLGADRILVVSMRSSAAVTPSPATADAFLRPNALFMLGKALNSLLLESTDQDLDRLNRINTILDAGVRAYGPAFLDQINAVLVPPTSAPLRPVRALHIRPSRDLSEIVIEYLQSPDFAPPANDKTGRRFKDLAAKDPSAVADAASHLLFDGGHAQRLMDLGWQDARARHDELVAFFSASKEEIASAKPVAA